MRTINVLTKSSLIIACCTAMGSLASPANAVSSAELYTSESFPYGRFEARVQLAGGDGVVGSFFLWKDASEMSDVFWNELDIETVWADCEMFSNALYGLPEASHTQSHGTNGDWCTSFHTYAYEWTPDYIAWFIDGVEVRRETEADNAAFRDNADAMQIHFNVWPGDSTFGGNFSPDILPLFEYINWVQYSSYADGEFTLEWREDFGGDSLPEGWATGDWDSPKGLSTHSPDNVAFIDGYAVLSMTADDAIGSTGATPMDPEGAGPIVESQPDEPVDEAPAQPEPGPAPVDPVPPAATEPPPDTPAQPPTDPAPGDTTANPPPGETPPSETPPPETSPSQTPPGESPPGELASGEMPPGEMPGATPPNTTAPGAETGGATQPPPGATAAQPGPVPGAPTSPVTSQAAAPGASSPAAVPAAGTAAAGTEGHGDSGGGCRMSRGASSSPWAWIGLLLGLSASWVRRRARRRLG